MAFLDLDTASGYCCSVQPDGEIIDCRPVPRRVRHLFPALFLVGFLVELHSLYVLLHPASFVSIQVSKAYAALPAGIVLMGVYVVVLCARPANKAKLFATRDALELIGPKVRYTARWSEVEQFEASRYGMNVAVRYLGESTQRQPQRLVNVLPVGGTASEFAAFLNALKASRDVVSPRCA